MKVLMFGWEFPPHISGGLGTACFGLTQSLVKENTQILFVIPKGTSDEAEENLKIISASDICIKAKEDKMEGYDLVYPLLNDKQQPLITDDAAITTITVPSILSPYTALSQINKVILRVAIQKTAISFQELQAPNAPMPHTKDEKGRVRYSFSGTYGPNLPEEVTRYAEVAAEIARQNCFDIIHAHDWLTYPAGIAAKEVSGKPLVVHVHATEYDRAGADIDPRVYKLEREGMERADRIITVSHWTKRIVTTRYGIPENKITVVHNGVVEKNENVLIPLPPIGKKVVTFLGRLTFQKGPEYFIEAAAKVLDKCQDVHFVMAGSGDLMPKMIENAAKLGISSHFHFTGFLKGGQVDRIWAISDVYVMPSVSEPFGITPLEAIQAGVPVIISNQSGVGEVISHAIKVDFWDVNEFANAICMVLKYRSLSETLRKKAKQEVSQTNWRKAAKKVNAIYHELQS